MTNQVKVGANAAPTADTVNSSAASISAFLRPQRAASGPAAKAPTTQPITTLETAQPVSAGLRSK